MRTADYARDVPHSMNPPGPAVKPLRVLWPVIHRRNALLPILFALAWVGGCAPMSADESRSQILDAQTARQLYQREWNLKGLTVDGRDIVVDLDTRISVRFAPDGRVAGYAAVNRFSGVYNFGGNGKLNWGTSGFATTRRMGPPELMEKEDAFLRALGKTNAAILARHALILQSDDAATVLTFSEAGN